MVSSYATRTSLGAASPSEKIAAVQETGCEGLFVFDSNDWTGTAASGTAEILSSRADGDIINLDGHEITLRLSVTAPQEINLGADASATATNLKTYVTANLSGLLGRRLINAEPKAH